MRQQKQTAQPALSVQDVARLYVSISDKPDMLPIKPYWPRTLKLDNGQRVSASFYSFAESFGIQTDAIKGKLTRRGFYAEHCPDRATAKQQTATTAASALASFAQRRMK